MSSIESIELIGGPEHRVIRIAEYNAQWPALFAEQYDRVREALGSHALRIDHIGSTSVPGLAAKPIIDIDLSVADVEDEDSYLPALIEAGYVHRVREPEHRLVRTPARDIHLHICNSGSSWERRHLLFRDWLRTSAEDRQAYETVKRRLATQDWPDTNAYADAKGPLIGEITERAEAWAASFGWTTARA